MYIYINSKQPYKRVMNKLFVLAAGFLNEIEVLRNENKAVVQKKGQKRKAEHWHFCRASKGSFMVMGL